MNYKNNNIKKNSFKIKHFVIIFVILFFTFGIIFSNYYFKVKNIQIEFFDESNENLEIKDFTENLIRKNSNTFLNFAFLDEENITKLVHDEYNSVSEINISKNYKLGVVAVVKKNQEYFYTCTPPEYNFLVNCMLGNVDGIYYKEIQAENYDQKKINIEISKKVLYDNRSNEKIENPDSLSGTRIYTKEEFLVLREVINWLVDNGFVIEKAFVDELKIVNIYTDNYIIKINLSKGYAQTIKDFELISRNGELQKYINGDKEKIEYIDLTFFNKVFYRLKNGDFTNKSTTTASTTTSTTTEIIE